MNLFIIKKIVPPLGKGNKSKKTKIGSDIKLNTFNLYELNSIWSKNPIKKLIANTINSINPNPLNISLFTFIFFGIK